VILYKVNLVDNNWKHVYMEGWSREEYTEKLEKDNAWFKISELASVSANDF